jgi:hypothetical protein
MLTLGHTLVRRGAQVVAGAWFLSWFALYLEIFRWRHVVPSRLASVVWPTVGSADQPGGFVRTIVVCSAVVPFVFLTLAVAQRNHRTPSGRGALGSRGAKFLGPEALAVFGGALSVLGVINQSVRHQPFVVDLTLRRGNGGFVVVGVTLAAAGVLMHRQKQREASRPGMGDA